MAFDEVQFPPTISFGMTGGPRFNTTVLVSSNGYESRNRHWAHPRRIWNVSQRVRKQDELDELVAFFYARNGALNGFRFKDWIDYRHDFGSSPAAQPTYPALGDASNVEFQLVKEYSDSAYTHRRAITKPVEGTITIYVNDVESTETTDYMIDYNTGIVTFEVGSTPPNGQAITWEGEFDVPVRFDGDDMPVSIEHFEIGDWGAIRIVEIRDPAVYVPQNVSASAFHSVQMPNKVWFGVTGGPNFKTQTLSTTGGHEGRAQNWASSRNSYVAEFDLQDFDEFRDLLNFFHARNGRAFGFRFRDWLDYKHDMSDDDAYEEILVAVGGETAAQIIKTYEISGYERSITKPIDGTIEIYVTPDGGSRTLMTETTEYTIDYETGVITFVSPLTALDTIEWRGEFDVPVRFNDDTMSAVLLNHGRFNWSSIRLTEIRI